MAGAKPQDLEAEMEAIKAERELAEDRTAAFRQRFVEAGLTKAVAKLAAGCQTLGMNALYAPTQCLVLSVWSYGILRTKRGYGAMAVRSCSVLSVVCSYAGARVMCGDAAHVRRKRCQ
eukprot:1099627-Rhodomonas_salina.1